MDVVIFTCLSGIFFQRSLGAYQLAHFLREHGYSVQVIDFTDYMSGEELLSTTKQFVSEKTLAIGISTTFYTVNDTKNKFINNDNDKYEFSTLPENILSTINHLKEEFPQLKIVAGGAKSEAASNIPVIDTVIHGYAEDRFLDYLNNLPTNSKHKKAKTFQIQSENSCPRVISTDPLNKLFSIEKLSHRFTKQDCILPGETLPLEVSRGCIFKCSFCAFPLNGKSKLDYLRDPELIKDELIHNYENFGTTNYFLSDDTFNDSTEKLYRLHKVITSLPFKINFVTYLRLDLLNAHKEQISLLKEMGLASPFFGIESLNQKSASVIGKGMNVDKSKEFLLDLYYNHWKEEIPITCSFIIGLPYETKETIQNTYDWVRNTPINSIFFPLALTHKSFYKSEFDTNHAKYGYTMDVDTGYWENENFTFKEATDLAESYNQELMRKNDYPSSWFLITLLNHGYTLEEAKKTQNSQLNYNRILREKVKNIKVYKQKLNEINTIKGDFP